MLYSWKYKRQISVVIRGYAAPLTTPLPYFLQNGHFFHTFADFLAAAVVVRMENVG